MTEWVIGIAFVVGCIIKGLFQYFGLKQIAKSIYNIKININNDVNDVNNSDKNNIILPNEINKDDNSYENKLFDSINNIKKKNFDNPATFTSRNTKVKTSLENIDDVTKELKNMRDRNE